MFEVGSMVRVKHPTLDAHAAPHGEDVSDVPAFVFDRYLSNGEMAYVILFRKFRGCYDMRGFCDAYADISQDLCCQHLYGDRLEPM